MFSRYSVKRPYTVLVGVVLVIVLGIVSLMKTCRHMAGLPSMYPCKAMVFITLISLCSEHRLISLMKNYQQQNLFK